MHEVELLKRVRARLLSKVDVSQRLYEDDPDQYNIERQFAALNVIRQHLENSEFQFDVDEDAVTYGCCELGGVEDSRDEQGVGGAWVEVRFYVPNLDIDTEIDS